jgi:hypothetical protein
VSAGDRSNVGFERNKDDYCNSMMASEVPESVALDVQTWSGLLSASFRPLPDKPEETVDSTIRALWHLACGNPVSAARAVDLPLPPLDGVTAHRLSVLVQKRIEGTPLAHLTGR